MTVASPPCCTCGRGSAAFGQSMTVAPPCLLHQRTVISCRWETGGDGHRRIRLSTRTWSDGHFAKHGGGR